MGSRRSREWRYHHRFRHHLDFHARDSIPSDTGSYEAAGHASGDGDADSGVRSLLECIGRDNAEVSKVEFRPGRGIGADAAGNELLHIHVGRGEVSGGASGEHGGGILGDRESDATRVLVGVRQGKFATRFFPPRLCRSVTFFVFFKKKIEKRFMFVFLRV